MSRHHRRSTALLLATFALLLAVPATTVAHPCIPFTQASFDSYTVVQEFKINSQTGTAWQVRWGESSRDRGLVITGAWFKRSLTEPWRQVLYSAELSQVYVPYHPEQPRLKDLNVWSHLNEMTALEAGPCGQVGPPVPYSNGHISLPPRPVVAKEIRTYGISYLKKEKPVGSPVVTRRGQALVLWGTYDTGNYDYIMEYAFRDDGTITFRLGAAGFNHPGLPRTAHSHTALWRIDTDLGGWSNDTATVFEHVETPSMSGVAVDQARFFNGGREGSELWNPYRFTSVPIFDTTYRNAYNHAMTWEVLPLGRGLIRHWDDNPGFPHHKEEFAQRDFWITRYRSSDIWGVWVHKYAQPPEPIIQQDIVLWALTGAHHWTRDEDLRYFNQEGATYVMWSGFDLRPRNVFDATPLLP